MQALCSAVFLLLLGVSEMMPWYCDWIACGQGHNAVCVYLEEALSICKHEVIFGFFLRKMLVSWTKAGAPVRSCLEKNRRAESKTLRGGEGSGKLNQ